MSRRKLTKANLDLRDPERVLITETAPYEVPVIFSNEGFYSNLSKIKTASTHLVELINAIVLENKRNYTVPYRYKIAKDGVSARRLSLIHPAAQFSVSRFYKRYENLICYYSSISEFSIRYPDKIGSSFFFMTPYSEVNKYKKNTIDTVELDQSVRNPASYFSYKYYDRLYKFFGSADFQRLEKKFPKMIFLDVSNCFGSIYSHSISWAVKSVEQAKRNISASSFGNDFDKLMQHMNFNETNGICIGPEVSRIFAEIILQRIDADIVSQAKRHELISKVHFECRRYVDDYIVFSEDDEVSSKIKNIIADRLDAYNLHLNEQKLERYDRPFQTKKSQIISEIEVKLSRLAETISEKTDDSPRRLVPRRLFKPDAVVRHFIASIRACCFDRAVGYDMVANYIVSSLTRMTEDLVVGYAPLLDDNKLDDQLYVSAVMVLLELIYFFYTVQPTVAASFKIAKATILSCEFFAGQIPDRQNFLAEKLSAWMEQMVRTLRPEDIRGSRGTIPIEMINVVLALSDVSSGQRIDAGYLRTHLFDIKNGDYFSLTSCLYYIKSLDQYASLRDEIERRLAHDVMKNADVLGSAHDAHLLLDALSCPHLGLDFRANLLKAIRRQCGLAELTDNERRQDVEEMEARPWFIQWKSVNLLSLIRKKELSAVY